MAVHAAQHAVGDVLKRNVNIFKYARIIPYFGNQLVRHLVGVAVKQAEVCRLGCRGKLAQQPRQRIFAVKIDSVAGDILCYHIYLACAERFKVARLGDKLLYRAAAEFSAYRGDGAVGAAVVAALRYLEVCPELRRRQHAVAAKLHLVLGTE